MVKHCTCSHTMEIRLRKLIFSDAVKIDNVPVYSCEHCGRSEVFPEVKEDLKTLLKQLGSKPEKQHIHFDEANELANLLNEATKKERMHLPVETIVRDRVNELLDMLLLAQSLEDPRWAEDIRERLSQITKGNFATYRLS